MKPLVPRRNDAVVFEDPARHLPEDLPVGLRAILGTLLEASASRPSDRLAGRTTPRQAGAATNACAHSIRLRTVLGTLPGAVTVRVLAFEAWTIVVIAASSDESLIALSGELGLEASEIGTEKGRWWRRAIWDSDELRVVVAGPHHLGPPPDGPGTTCVVS